MHIINIVKEKSKWEEVLYFMDMNTRDTIMKKLLDAQENVRDYETFSKKVEDKEVADTFKQFAEETGMQARKLQGLIDKYDR